MKKSIAPKDDFRKGLWNDRGHFLKTTATVAVALRNITSSVRIGLIADLHQTIMRDGLEHERLCRGSQDPAPKKIEMRSSLLFKLLIILKGIYFCSNH